MDVNNFPTTNSYSRLNPYKGKAGEDPATIHYCPKGHRVTFHSIYIKAGIVGCVRNGCEQQELVAERLCRFRGWTFVKFIRGKNSKVQPKVQSICDKGHERKMKYENLRLGANCKSCEKVKGIHSSCGCELAGIGHRNLHSHSWICEHYNHAVLYTDSAAEWDNENPLNNGITPNMLEPVSGKKGWFKCKQCKMPYDQAISKRVRGDRCPYCRGLKVCEWNSAAASHPHLVKEWDKSNHFTLYDVPRCSTLIGLWFCDKHKEKPEDEPFTWPALIYSRTNKDQPSGCPKCNNRNYEQEFGGKEYFVKVVNKIHNGEYEYPGDYINDKTKMAILCKIHGIFYQSPHYHKIGGKCKACLDQQKDSKGIRTIKKILDELEIRYVTEEKFDGLKYKLPLRIDIYLIDYKLCIEYDGEQHFKAVEFWGGERAFLKGRIKDLIKDVYCVKNGLNLLRIPFNANINKELLVCVIDMCKSGQQYCISYPEFIQNTNETLNDAGIDLSKIVSYSSRHAKVK